MTYVLLILPDYSPLTQQASHLLPNIPTTISSHCMLHLFNCLMIVCPVGMNNCRYCVVLLWGGILNHTVSCLRIYCQIQVSGVRLNCSQFVIS